jgi:hypothetical protein
MIEEQLGSPVDIKKSTREHQVINAAIQPRQTFSGG